MSSMTLPQTPSTPRAGTPSTPQAGTWKHPRFEEIARRQNASTFSDKNVKQIVFNIGGICLMWLVESLLLSYTPGLFQFTKPLRPYIGYAYNTFRVLLVYNVLVAMLPVIRPKDDLADIPLTPAQRRLLGLSETETPPTPGSAYITPPRFARSSSPLGGASSATSGREGSSAPSRGSPFSPNASPLLHKAIGGAAKRTSLGSPNFLGQGGNQKSWLDTPGSPSPSSGKPVSVGLNNKWLYEKGRGSPGNASMFSQSTV